MIGRPVSLLSVLGLVVLGAAGCQNLLSRPAYAPSDRTYVAEWMRLQFGLARAEAISPPAAARAGAYGAVAYYEAVAAASRTLRSLGGQLNGLGDMPPPPLEPWDPLAAAAAAQADVLRALYGAGAAGTLARIDALEGRQLERRRQAGVDAEALETGIAFGGRIAERVAAWAGSDGFAATRDLPFAPPEGPGLWVPTSQPHEYASQMLSSVSEVVYLGNPTAEISPGGASSRLLVVNQPKLAQMRRLETVNPSRALEPHWWKLRPFILRNVDECAPPPPAPYSEEPGSDFYRETEAVYEASLVLTEEQKDIALFWADNPGQTGTPAGHWISIMALVAEQHSLDVETSAEMFALGTVAIADAFISCWRAKYRWNLVRPITVIRQILDPAWATLVTTPPFPEYTSGHSVQSGAAAEVLTRLVGELPFEDRTQVSLGHAPRWYPSFRAAAEEAAISRLYGGIHYPMAIHLGVEQGTCIGRLVAERIRTRRGP